MQFDEGPPHPFRVGEPDSQRDLLDRFAAALQAQPRRFDTQALDRLRRCFSGFPAKCAPELPQTQTCGLGEPLDRQRFRQCSRAKFSAMRMRSDSGSICDIAELGLTASDDTEPPKPGDSARNLRAHILSIKPSAKSMPDAMPADVQMRPASI